MNSFRNFMLYAKSYRTWTLHKTSLFGDRTLNNFSPRFCLSRNISKRKIPVCFTNWRFNSHNQYKIKTTHTSRYELSWFGAGDRTWTCTGVPPEPKSGASANSATPANHVTDILYHIQIQKSNILKFFSKMLYCFYRLYFPRCKQWHFWFLP